MGSEGLLTVEHGLKAQHPYELNHTEPPLHSQRVVVADNFIVKNPIFGRVGYYMATATEGCGAGTLNSSSLRHSVNNNSANLRATATRAFASPFFSARRKPHSLRGHVRFTLLSKQLADSISNQRSNESPCFVILPLYSIEPDWCTRGAKPT